MQLIDNINRLSGDSAGLVDAAFSGSPPELVINSWTSEIERGEQRGFVSLLKGVYGVVRNPLAHEAKIKWEMSEQGALDTSTMLSLIHRKLDKARRYSGSTVTLMTIRSMARLLDPFMIPEELWDSDTDCIGLPKELVELWKQALNRHSLTEDAKRRDTDKPPVGGLTPKLSAQHFAQAFDGSVARAELALLDPKHELHDTPDILIKALAGGRVCLVDAPSGAGAASLAFLSTIAALRKHSVLPRYPLDVELILGELSSHARGYADELLRAASPALSTEGIHVTHSLYEWNVLDNISNTRLVREMTLAGNNSCDTLLVVANFSHFLQRQGKFDEALPCLSELFRHASINERTHALWIEPPMNAVLASGGLFGRLLQQCVGAWRKFVTLLYSNDVQLVSRCEFLDPLETELQHRCEVAVMPLPLKVTV